MRFCTLKNDKKEVCSYFSDTPYINVGYETYEVKSYSNKHWSCDKEDFNNSLNLKSLKFMLSDVKDQLKKTL